MHRMAIPLLAAALTLLVLPVATGVSAEIDMAATVREYQVVPCLLPARVRRLGGMTYPERRKLVETSARDCELRGGEYTYYDRAQPESAAKFFRKLADDGDLDAQLNLGDVYQYLYSPPRYDDAAQWYRKAADGGNTRAKMQLARLYERGEGVAKDELLAVNLWREATGAGEELVLASEVDKVRTAADERIAQLTLQLQQRSEEAADARRQLAEARADVQQRKAALGKAESQLLALNQQVAAMQAASGGDPAELNRLRDQIASQQRTIDAQRYQIESIEGDMGVQEAQLAARLKQVETQNERLNQELARVSTAADDQVKTAQATLAARDAEIARLTGELDAARAAVTDAGGTFDSLSKALADAREEAGRNASAQARLQELEKRHAAQAATLRQRQAELADREARLAAVSGEVTTLRSKLDTQINETQLAKAEFAKLEAEIARKGAALAQKDDELAAANERLKLLTAERDALQSRPAPSADSTTKAQLAAQDNRIREQQSAIEALRSEMEEYRGQIQEINLRRQAYASRSPVEDTSRIRLPSGVKLGRYHALVIGNDNYRALTRLENARSDATAVHELLKSDYGFNSRLLLDATRLDMYQGIAALKDLTGPDDLVLIYYAGHGFSTRDQSFWLGVEVASLQDAPGTGLSSEDVANWIKTLPARHVLVIADSCYSGSGIEPLGHGATYSATALASMLPYLIRSRSRTMLTSGGDGPVMDGGGEGRHSVFTRELLGVLKENKGLIHGEQVFGYLLDRVKFTADGDTINQTPTFGSIDRAGHESGQFVFRHGNVRT
ncbi:MAG: caspase family protein [Pseudomonadales bacterium]|nr:caspase family protein [Pseudomonadales bacterium]